jgi:uncharacterized protein
MIIPYQQLSTETLHALVEEFITRNGTDYGEFEVSLEDKAQQLLKQLKKGDVVIVFDPAFETCSILTASDAQHFNALHQNEID